MYTKLANSILTSTVWMESDQTRIVWLTLLAMCDKNGEVQASIPGLANVARVGVEDCEKAMKLFLSPDPYSRTKTDQGRRIEEIDGGWMVLNHEKYRDLASDSDTKKKAAERQRRYRERQKRNGENVTSNAQTVTGRDKSHQISHTDTDTDNNKGSAASEVVIPKKLDDHECRQAAENWFSYLDKKGLEDKSPRSNDIALEAWWRQMSRLGRDGFLEAVEQSMAAGRWNVELKTPSPGRNSKSKPDESAEWIKCLNAARSYPTDYETRLQILGTELFEALKRTGTARVSNANDFELKTLSASFSEHLKDVRSGTKVSN